MKLVCIYSEIPNQGLFDVMKIVYNTLNDLNIEIEVINLKNRIPFYEDAKNGEVDEIIKKIQASEACILATSVSMFSPCALLKTFLDYCNHPDYSNVFFNKHFLSISVSKTFGETEASEYLYKVINVLGGIELERIAIGGNELASLNMDKDIQWSIEKDVEDFYRNLKQNKRIIVPSEVYIYREYYNNLSIPKSPYNEIPYNLEKESPPTSPSFEQAEEAPDLKANDDFNEIKELLNNIRNKANTMEKDNEFPLTNYNSNEVQFNPVMKETPIIPKVEPFKAQFEAFEEKQEEDTRDINKIFSQSPDDNISIPSKSVTYERPNSLKSNEIVYREKTCKQMIFSLPHHFQSHLALNLNMVFQINITGNENFDCYLIISNSQTSVNEGIAPKADIFIYTSDVVMKDILKGKYSTQKAFMTGQLKVRGNFVLLNKLDQLYKKIP